DSRPERGAIGRRLFGTRRTRRRGMRGAVAQRVHDDGTGGMVGVAAFAFTRSAPELDAGRSIARLPRAAKSRRARAARAHRRLHRFLRIDTSRDERRQADASGQSVAAELQMGPDRLSRPWIVDTRFRIAIPSSP